MIYKLILDVEYVDNYQEIQQKLETLKIDIREVLELEGEFKVDMTDEQYLKVKEMPEFCEILNLDIIVHVPNTSNFITIQGNWTAGTWTYSCGV